MREIFNAGTISNAKQFHVADDYGTVQLGKIANLLQLNGSPLIDLCAWDEIEKMIVRGEVIECDSLRAE